MPSSDPTLRRWFLKYNSAYFAGELPESTVLFFEACNGHLGVCEPLDDDDWMIRIDPALRFSDRLWKVTLLHELVHLSGIHGHGRKFLAEMDRLYSLGAFRKLL
jgi:hypothetical protein